MTYPHPPEDRTQPVLHWRDGGVAHIRFNRPKALNAIDAEMAGAFLRACREIAQDAEVRAVCLAGEGRAFMAGGDIAQMQRDPATVSAQLIEGMHGAIGVLAALDAPVIAQVHGAAAGAGLGLALSCDLVVAAEGTRFSVAYPLIGASCDCATSWALPRAVGFAKAMELALLSPTLDAQEALRVGLVNRVVPQDRLADEVGAILRQLAAGPTRALGQIKRLLRASMQNGLQVQLDAEAEGFVRCARTGDFAEGAAAFLEKRPARFSGR